MSGARALTAGMAGEAVAPELVDCRCGHIRAPNGTGCSTRLSSTPTVSSTIRAPPSRERRTLPRRWRTEAPRYHEDEPRACSYSGFGRSVDVRLWTIERRRRALGRRTNEQQPRNSWQSRIGRQPERVRRANREQRRRFGRRRRQYPHDSRQRRMGRTSEHVWRRQRRRRKHDRGRRCHERRGRPSGRRSRR
jgi:hypothetical protein